MAEKKLTGKIASEHIRMMETPRPPEGIIEGFRALGDATGIVSDVMVTSCSASTFTRPRAGT